MSRDDSQGVDLLAGGAQRHGIVGEMVGFLKEHKKWWLAPILLSVVVLGVLVLLAGSAAAPFIYTLF
jgi:hypothetical protein